MKTFKEYLFEARKGFKKSRNPGTNQGAGTRGKVHIDITAPTEDLANQMEEKLVELGYESAEYGDDLGEGGYVFTMVVDSIDMKEFNQDYNQIKKELAK